MCFNKECTDYRKSIKREQSESDFEILLKDLRPSRELLLLAFDMFRDLWDNRLALQKESGKVTAKGTIAD